MLAQSQAVSQMQASMSEETTTYQDQRMLNEQLIKEVSEQAQQQDAARKQVLRQKQEKVSSCSSCRSYSSKCLICRYAQSMTYSVAVGLLITLT